MKLFKALLLTVLVVVGAIGGFVYSGLYPIGADVPHSDVVYKLLEITRERSIERAASEIRVPSLDDPDMLLAGAADYDCMCVQCHLKPGQESSDMSLGLYPVPPNLASGKASDGHDHVHGTPEQQAQKYFWVIKHGIKASGMPAWGLTHDDRRIWGMVAFLQQLPSLTPDQYQILTASGGDDESH